MPCCPEQEEFQLILQAFVRSISILEKDQMSCYGITPQQASTLNIIANTPGITMKALSERLGVATSTLTRNIDTLEKDGVVTRARTSDDSRTVLVSLTEEGQAKLEQVQQCYESYFENILSRIEPSEREVVLKGLKILFRAVNDCCRCC